MGEKFLCVISDDFGMHPAINEGIVQAFTDGLLTDSNLMAPCPAFDQAARLAKQHHIPVGLHATFTCDWDLYRWGSLTAARSFRASDGGLKQRVEDAWADADETEALEELRAQYEMIADAGIQITHIGEHMGFDDAGKFKRVMAAFSHEQNLPHKGDSTMYANWIARYQFDGGFATSGYSTRLAETKAYLKSELFRLSDGYNIWLVHAAMDHPSLDAMCTPNHPAVHWARTFRAIDQALLLDAQVRDWLEELEIERVPLSACPIKRASLDETLRAVL